MPRPALVYGTFLIWLAGCSDFPQLQDDLSASDRAAPYPVLAPIEDLQREQPAEQITPETEAALEARVAALKARAEYLRNRPIE